MNRTKKATAIALVLGTAALAFGQTIPNVTLEAALSGLENHEAVRQARINLNIKTQVLAAETGWKGPQISFAPSTTYNDASGDLKVAATSLGADLVFPTGLSAVERERKTAAAAAYALAEAELAEAYGKAYLDIFASFTAAYAAQDAAALAAKEVELARLRLDSAAQKVGRGLVPFSEQTDAEEEFQDATEKLIQSRLVLRLAWYSLAYAAGLETVKGGTPKAYLGEMTDIPRFEYPEEALFAAEVPQAGVLIALAKSRGAAVLAQRQKADAASRALSNLKTYDLNLTPRIAYSTPDASVSAGYSTSSATVLLGSDWSFYDDGTISAGGAKTADNTVTLSLTLSGNPSPARTSEREALKSMAALEERKLDALEQGLELTIRSKYAAYLKAQDSLAATERAYRFARETADVAKTKAALGQLNPEDQIAADVLLARNAFAASAAKLNLARSRFDLIAASNAWNLIGVNPIGQ